MTTFPTLVYKDGGNCQRPGGTFSWRGAADQAAFDALIAEGWSTTLADAVNPPMPEDAPMFLDDAEQWEDIDNVPPSTHEELVAKAKELGLKFGHRLGDEKLRALIRKALCVPISKGL